MNVIIFIYTSIMPEPRIEYKSARGERVLSSKLPRSVLHNLEVRHPRTYRDVVKEKIHWPSIRVDSESALWANVNFLLFDKNALPPYGINLLPTAEDLKDVSKLAASVAVATSVLLFAYSDQTFAGSPQNADVIQWSLDALKNPDSIQIFINKETPNARHTGAFKPSDLDMVWMIKNIHEEGSVLSKVGRLGIILSVLERMKSPNHPSGMMQVILQRYQYSWTNKLLKQEPKATTDDNLLPTYLNTSVFTNNILHKSESREYWDNIDEAIDNVKLQMRVASGDLGLEIPDNLTDYHVLGMADIKQYSKDVEDPTTKMKILLLEYLHSNRESVNLPNELAQARRHILYIPHPKELSEDPKTSLEFKGRGHIHYSEYFRTKENIDRLFKLLPTSNEITKRLSAWSK